MSPRRGASGSGTARGRRGAAGSGATTRRAARSASSPAPRKVFFHELAHAAHHRIAPLRGGQDARQEIVAETAAAVLCLLYGFEGYVAEAREYVAHYASEPPSLAVRGVMRHLAEIEQVLELIVTTARDLAESSTTPAA